VLANDSHSLRISSRLERINFDKRTASPQIRKISVF
jgi:hypothetical protein